MNDEILLIIFTVIFCAGISFLLSGMEAGILALSPLRIRQLRRAGNPRAEVLHQYLERPENFLWTILVGNTIANFTVLSFVVIFTVEWIRGPLLLRIFVFSIFVFLFYVLCELLPKMLFRLYPNRLCLFMARPFRAVHFSLSPLVALVSWLARWLLVWTGGKRFTGHLFGNRDELRFMIQDSGHAITSEEKAMINRVLDSQHLPLRQITVPLANTVMVSAETPLSETLKVAGERRLTRIPVWRKEQGLQKILGIISLKTLLYSELDASKPTGDFVRPALFLSEDLRIEEALRRMQRSGQRLAIVLGRDQREVGIVSLQDILKSIFGEVSL